MEDARRPARWGAGGWTALSPCGDVTQQQTEGPCRPGGPVTTPENVVPARRIPRQNRTSRGPMRVKCPRQANPETRGESSRPRGGRGVGAPSDRREHAGAAGGRPRERRKHAQGGRGEGRAAASVRLRIGESRGLRSATKPASKRNVVRGRPAKPRVPETSHVS